MISSKIVIIKNFYITLQKLSYICSSVKLKNRKVQIKIFEIIDHLAGLPIGKSSKKVNPPNGPQLAHLSI